MPALRTEGLTRFFGGVKAVEDVSISIAPGERRAIIGPNGAGKTTLFNLLSGEIRPTRGGIYLSERNVIPLAVNERARLGIGRAFQRNSLFPGLSVFENLRLAVQARAGVGHRSLVATRRLQHIEEETQRMLERLGLHDVAEEPAENISYGDQRGLEIALALVIGSRVLLLDEPTAGMSPTDATSVTRFLMAVPRQVTMIIVAHDMDVVFQLADQITVMSKGRVIAEGTPGEIRVNDYAVEAYLGVHAGRRNYDA